MTGKSTKGAAAQGASRKEQDTKVAKAQIVEQMAGASGLTKKQAGDAFDTVIDSIVGSLRDGKSVGLPRLGTLSVRATAERTGVRPGTSEKILIPAGKKVAFKVAADLKSTL
ncbi:HU family DNA-binding protein [Deinococcus ficus]|uniref:DNA-binding protein n=1 Tax=Deinococcus ficus TaxID=317577 RepID=A0A221T2N9_9DEIO|nr:HU family DNA-binding protein [Deinococcus ficus]ASN83165.1 DNA-binding protein [Deinococcus ficus]